MLLRFEVSNHRSIMEPVELSMIAVDEDRPAARVFERLNERVLTVAGIYGPNASGKTNVLEALAWLARAVRVSLRVWDDEIPREPFRFGTGPESSSTYDLGMMVNGVRYEYAVELDGDEVVVETLHSYPERKPRLILERDGLNVRFRRGMGSLAGTRELLTPTTLALSAAMRFDVPEVRDFARSLSDIGTLGLRRWSPGRGRRYPYASRLPSTRHLFLGDDDTLDKQFGSQRALTLLRFADLGIDDVAVVEEYARSGGEVFRDLKFLHQADGQQVPFDLDDESAGTRTWFGLIGPVLGALRAGQVLLFDEIDASLHPRLSAQLVELFQDPEANPHGAQLIFTTHDTSLLNFLNRDEVWLTEKIANGATTLTALAEYGGDKVRRSMNLERAYLQGRFGAVPELDQRLLRSALGIAASEG